MASRAIVLTSKGRDVSLYPTTTDIKYTVNFSKQTIKNVRLKALEFLRGSGDSVSRNTNDTVYFSEYSSTGEAFFSYKIPEGVYDNSAAVDTLDSSSVNMLLAKGLERHKSQADTSLDQWVNPSNTEYTFARPTSNRSSKDGYYILSDGPKTVTIHLSQVNFEVIEVVERTTVAAGPSDAGEPAVTFRTNIPHGMLRGAMLDTRPLGRIAGATVDVNNQRAIVMAATATTFTVRGDVSEDVVGAVSPAIPVRQASLNRNFFRGYKTDVVGSTFSVTGVAYADNQYTFEHEIIWAAIDTSTRLGLSEYTGLSGTTPFPVEPQSIPHTYTRTDVDESITASTVNQPLGNLRCFITTAANSGINNYFQLSTSAPPDEGSASTTSDANLTKLVYVYVDINGVPIGDVSIITASGQNQRNNFACVAFFPSDATKTPIEARRPAIIPETSLPSLTMSSTTSEVRVLLYDEDLREWRSAEDYSIIIEYDE